MAITSLPRASYAPQPVEIAVYGLNATARPGEEHEPAYAAFAAIVNGTDAGFDGAGTAHVAAMPNGPELDEDDAMLLAIDFAAGRIDRLRDVDAGSDFHLVSVALSGISALCVPGEEEALAHAVRAALLDCADVAFDGTGWIAITDTQDVSLLDTDFATLAPA